MLLFLLACASPTPEPAPEAPTTEASAQVKLSPKKVTQVEGTADRATDDSGARVAGTPYSWAMTLEASTTLPAEKDLHAVYSLRDGSPLTAWIAEGNGQDAVISFTPNEPTPWPREIGIVGGFAQNEETWANHARPVQIELRFKQVLRVTGQRVPVWKTSHLNFPADAEPLKPVYFRIDNPCGDDLTCASMFRDLELKVTKVSEGDNLAISEVLFY
ncbi:MAG: hypothetical protein KC912_13700 [Proteobacteria bacterium]|nr:hypothetical protein [Pseudomonadota bacterium]